PLFRLQPLDRFVYAYQVARGAVRSWHGRLAPCRKAEEFIEAERQRYPAPQGEEALAPGRGLQFHVKDVERPMGVYPWRRRGGFGGAGQSQGAGRAELEQGEPPG